VSNESCTTQIGRYEMDPGSQKRLLVAAAQVTRALPMNFSRFFKENTMYCPV